MAFGDLDNDGKIDAVVTALNAPPEIFIHRSPEPNHWLLIRLVGTTSNRDGLGAKIKITTAGGASQYNHATTSTGLSASSDGRVHFGLGTATHPYRQTGSRLAERHPPNPHQSPPIRS